MLTIIEKVIFLQDIEEFAEIPTEQLSHIASITEEIPEVDYLETDTTIIQQDEPAEALYLVLEGKVRLHRDGREMMVVEEKGEFGIWSLFDKEQPNIATATTLEPTRLLRIDREEFYEIVADYVEITQGILKSIAGRLLSLRHFGEKALESGKEVQTNDK